MVAQRSDGSMVRRPENDCANLVRFFCGLYQLASVPKSTRNGDTEFSWADPYLAIRTLLEFLEGTSSEPELLLDWSKRRAGTLRGSLRSKRPHSLRIANTWTSLRTTLSHMHMKNETFRDILNLHHAVV